MSSNELAVLLQRLSRLPEEEFEPAATASFFLHLPNGWTITITDAVDDVGLSILDSDGNSIMFCSCRTAGCDSMKMDEECKHLLTDLRGKLVAYHREAITMLRRERLDKQNVAKPTASEMIAAALQSLEKIG